MTQKSVIPTGMVHGHPEQLFSCLTLNVFRQHIEQERRMQARLAVQEHLDVLCYAIYLHLYGVSQDKST